MEESNLTNLFTGYKSFEMINIKNSSIPTVSVPDYPAEIVYDPVAGVVRACGGEEFHNDIDRCFVYDGLEWSEIAPMCEAWDYSNQGRVSFFIIPNVGWWTLALKYSCGGYSCNDIRSCLYNTDSNTWIEGPSFLTPEQYGYEYVPADFCSALVNKTHVMVIISVVLQYLMSGSTIFW